MAPGIFSSVKEKLKSLTQGSDESVLGIDIGSSSLKVVQLRASKNAAILETYGEIALGPYTDIPVGKSVKLSPEKTTEALLDVIREANVTAKSVGVSIPFSASLITLLDLPKVEEDQLKRVIPIEARKYIPVPVSEVTLDWFIVPEDNREPDAFDRVEKETMMQKRGQEVLLVAIHNDTLRNYQGIMSTSGLTTSFYEIEIFSTMRSTLGHSPAPVMIIDFGASTTKIYITERGVIRGSHLMNIGAQQMSETLARTMSWSFEKAERVKREWGLNDAPAMTREENDRVHQALLSTLTRVFAEANRVLLGYGKRYNREVLHAVLTGGGASLPGIAPVANNSLNAEVEIAHPFAKTETPAFLESVLREIGPAFSVAVGAALRKLQ